MDRILGLLLAGLVSCGSVDGGVDRFDPAVQDPPVADEAHPAGLEPVVVPGAAGRLVGTMYLADGPGPHPTVLLLHGIPGNETNADLAHAVRRAGWNALVVHYGGSWGSDGAFTFAGALDDVAAAIRFLRSEPARAQLRVDPGRIVLVGHSLGGFLALAGAAADPDVEAAASLAGFDFGAHARAMAADPSVRASTVAAFEEAVPVLAGATAEALVGEVEERGEGWALEKVATGLRGRPILLVAASEDRVAPPARHHRPLVRWLRADPGHEVTDVTLEAGHGFAETRIALARHLTGWLATLPAPRSRPNRIEGDLVLPPALHP